MTAAPSPIVDAEPVLPTDVVRAGDHRRVAVLDGWRAISILAVMSGHFLPLDALLPGANEFAAVGGMAIFFTLSGYLITRFLVERPAIKPFLIRRLLRIVPLAWLAIMIMFAMSAPDYDLTTLARNLAFVANLPPADLFSLGAHFWSLGVEMQFYAGIALLVALAGRRGLKILPLVAIAVTLARIVAGEHSSIVTWHRVDEILAGATLALVHGGHFGKRPKALLARFNLLWAIPLAILTCYALATPLAYARPYAVAAMVGATLVDCPRWLERALTCRAAIYVAAISYALYVFHGILGHTWLGSGDKMVKYAKRPLLLAATFALAHLSTFTYEAWFIALARRLTSPAPKPIDGGGGHQVPT